MAAKLPTQKILIELDCLLDTRIGTVAMMDDASATKVLESGYHSRDEDWFEGIDNAKYKKLYAARDIETLKYSTLTTFMPLLKHLCNLISEEAISRPYHSGPEIIVNVYPYQMSDDLADSIRAAISRWIGPMVPITMTRIEPKQITPQYCKDNLTLMVMYDPTEWFNANLEELIKNDLRDIALYIPQIYQLKKPTEKELEEIENDAINPFIALELVMKTVIDVTFLDVSYFSILDPKAELDFSCFRLDLEPQTAL